MFNRIIYSILIGLVMASGSFGCHAAGDHNDSAAPRQACQGKGKGGKPKPMDPHAKATMRAFQRATACGDWQLALDCCSPQVRSGVGQYASTEEFFRAIVPIERIALLPDFPICSSRAFPSDPGREGSYYESFVRLLEVGAGMTVSWTWKVERTAHGWQIEFQTTPLDQWIQQEVARRRARDDEYRDAQIRLLRDMKGISTRLTALGSRFRIGDAIPLRLELVNESSLELAYDDQQVDVNDSLRVTDRQGREIHAAQTTQTGGGWLKLRPGETAVLFDRLDITKQYAIRQPGHYSVQFRGRGLSVGVEDPGLKHQDSKMVGFPCRWPSNVVTIEVARWPTSTEDPANLSFRSSSLPLDTPEPPVNRQ